MSSGTGPDRRTVVRAGMWTVPTVTGVLAIPEFAAASAGQPDGISVSNPRITQDAGTSTYHVLFDAMQLTGAASDPVQYTIRTMWQDAAGGGAHTVTLLSFTGSGYSGPAPGTSGASFDWSVGASLTGAFDAAFDIPNGLPSGPNATICILFGMAVILDPVTYQPTFYQYNHPMQLPS